LTERFAHVRAVEPDARMRAVLAERAPGAEVVGGRAEEIPAGDASFDAVIGASSWHWVDETLALPEVARVLRPGGRFSVLWSGTDRSVDWMRSVFAGGMVLDAGQITESDARRGARHAVHLGPDSPFLEPERRVVRWVRSMTKDDLVGLAGTYSGIITMGAAERQDYLASISRFLDRPEIPSEEGVIAVPMRCICWRTALR
jgi:SAM-dependent methyltransferase